eukprot:1509734-Amphidinium_carterae.1
MGGGRALTIAAHVTGPMSCLAGSFRSSWSMRTDASPLARALPFPAGRAFQETDRRNSVRSSSDQSRGHPFKVYRWIPSFPSDARSSASSSFATRSPNVALVR